MRGVVRVASWQRKHETEMQRPRGNQAGKMGKNAPGRGDSLFRGLEVPEKIAGVG